MNTPKISILVPIYRVEPYLRRCLESVLNQKFQDWEMILVDDGSPDACPEICDEYAHMDARIKVIHKTNGGLISARKVGFQSSEAEWIMFLDSDDWLTEGALKFLYSKIDDGTDMVRGGTIFNGINEEILKEDYYQFEEGTIESNGEFMQRMFSQEVAPYLWGAIYRRSLFSPKVFDLGIKAGISFGEDWITNLLAGVNVRKASYYRHKVYHYFRNTDSIVHSCVMSLSYQQRIYDVLKDAGIIETFDLGNTMNRQLAEFILKCLFIPELSIEYKQYQESRKLIDSSILQGKRRLFFDSEVIYWYYAKIYRFVFKYIRLKGHSRKVLV